MKYFCSHCGSPDTKEEETGNDSAGGLVVMECYDIGEEVWDAAIVMFRCKQCNKISYASYDEDL